MPEVKLPKSEEPKVTASELTNHLLSKKDRYEGERTIYIKMVVGQHPEVVFTGFWTGKFVRVAQNAIARAYRRMRRRSSTNPPLVEKKEVKNG